MTTTIDTEQATTLYRLFDADGRLLYVGISGHVGRRMNQHSAGKPWWREATTVELAHHQRRAEALAAELAAIRTESPVYNILGRQADATAPRQAAPRQAASLPADPDRILQLPDRDISVRDIVGAAEIAGRCGVKRASVVHDWRARYPEFPEPFQTLTSAGLYDWREVEKWARATGRLKEDS